MIEYIYNYKYFRIIQLFKRTISYENSKKYIYGNNDFICYYNTYSNNY